MVSCFFCEAVGCRAIGRYHGCRAVYNLNGMYSAQLLDHFQNPRNAGELVDADAIAEIENPACGDVLRLSSEELIPGGLPRSGSRPRDAWLRWLALRL